MRPTRPRIKKIYFTASENKKELALYMAFSLLASLTMLVSPLWGIPFKVVYFYLPFIHYILIYHCHDHAEKA